MMLKNICIYICIFAFHMASFSALYLLKFLLTFAHFSYAQIGACIHAYVSVAFFPVIGHFAYILENK